MRFLCPVRLEIMFISRLHTARSLSLLTHILQCLCIKKRITEKSYLFNASLVPWLVLTKNTIAKPPSAITSWQKSEYEASTARYLFNSVIHRHSYDNELMNSTSTTTWCFPTVNFFPMKLLCAFSVLCIIDIKKFICFLKAYWRKVQQDNPT